MKNNILRYCFLLLIIPLAQVLIAQTNIAEESQKPSELLHQYILNHPNENFVIQTDRDLYFSGTELWFSVWSLDDQTLSPFSYSGIVYVELMDKNGNPIEQQILKLEKHKASGKIILPELLVSGTYYLRAYSNLQRNYGEHLFGIKIIQLINPSKPPVMTKTVKQNDPVVSVFPEGQKLLYGITNKLVFNATYPNGLFAGITDAYLIRQPHDTILQMDFLIPGWGYCSFYADTPHIYQLDLPGIGIIPLEIQDKGLALSIQEGETLLKIRALGQGISATEKHYLVGKNRGQVFFERILEQGLEEVNIPYSDLPGGLLEFSILNSNFEEYSQRLYYNELSIELPGSDLVFKKSFFRKGETIDVEIQLPEGKEFLLLSLSVTKDLFINQTLKQSFESYVNLHPFLNDWDEFGQLIQALPEDSRTEFLDTYLITKKSSKFTWHNVSHVCPEKLDFAPEVNTKHITGYGFNPANNMRIRNDNLLLYFVGKEAAILSSRTDNEGRFRFEYPVQKVGKSEIVVQAFGHKDKMEISFNWLFSQTVYDYKLEFFRFDSSRFDEYDKAYVQFLLEKMHKDKNDPVIHNDKRVIAFYGKPDSRTYLEDYVAMTNMEEVFKEIIPGEKISTRNDEYSLHLYHKEKYALLGDNPLLLFNGAPVQHVKEVLGIPVARVDFVDMVRQHYIMQDQVFDGIINIVTKDLDLQLKTPPNTFKTNLEIFSPESRFYRIQENRNSRIPDLNPSLYWNPDLFFEGNSRQITFKAGDNPGGYQVLLRGIDTEGKILELIKYIIIE